MRRVVGIAEGQLRNRRRRRLWCLLVAVGLATTPAPTAAQGVPDDFVIKLERTECYGECPVYSVSIDARGNVTYEGTKFVWVLGRQTDRIQVSRVATLLATAERIGFFDLHDNYNTISNPDGTWTFLTDLPTAFVTVTRGGRSKRVRDYLGAPEALKELEHLIDDTAGTKRWIRLDAQTLQQLVRDGWLPSRRTRTELLRKALQGDEVDMVKALLEIGADPNAASSRGKTPLRTVRSAAAARALLEAGAIPFAKDANDGTPLGWAVYFGPDVVEVLLKAGVPADEPTDSDGRTALLHAACVGDVGIVKVLLEAGANPTLRPDGTSALDCAREAREDRLRRSSGLDSYEDFDGVIALLEQALAKRK
jgi:hypothetical protein